MGQGTELNWNSNSAMCPPAGHFPSESRGPLDVQVFVSLLTVLRAPLAARSSSSLALELSSLSSQRVPRGAEPVDTLAAGPTRGLRRGTRQESAAGGQVGQENVK